MSDARFPQEPDELPWRRIALVALVVALGAVVCVAWAWRVARKPDGVGIGQRGFPPGAIERTLIQSSPVARQLRERQRRILESYGRVPGAPGRVRIPIERAMELVAAGARP